MRARSSSQERKKNAMSLNLATWPARKRLIIMAAVLAIAGLLVAAVQTGPAHADAASGARADAASGTTGTKPTIVLEHGAWADSSSWNGVVARLQRLGYNVQAPPNPPRSPPSGAA